VSGLPEFDALSTTKQILSIQSAWLNPSTASAQLNKTAGVLVSCTWRAQAVTNCGGFS